MPVGELGAWLESGTGLERALSPVQLAIAGEV